MLVGWLIDWLHVGLGPYSRVAPRPLLTGPLCPITIYGCPVTLPVFQMAPRLTYLIFSGSRKKERRCTCLSKAKALHLQRIWTEVSSSAPHFLHNGLSVSPIRWGCLLRVLCPVRRPVTTLDCILQKDKSLALVPRQGPEINSRVCLWVLPRLCYRPQCWFTNQRLILFLRSWCFWVLCNLCKNSWGVQGCAVGNPVLDKWKWANRKVLIGFRCYRMWCHVIGQLLSNILRDHSAFSIRQ
jgi:hypothetical protein